MGPERFHTQAEQPRFCVEGVGAAGDLVYEGGELLARNRPVVVAGIDDAHGLDLHRRAMSAHTKNAHGLRPEGTFDDGVCRYTLKHGMLCSVQFSVFEIKTAAHYTRVWEAETVVNEGRVAQEGEQKIPPGHMPQPHMPRFVA